VAEETKSTEREKEKKPGRMGAILLQAVIVGIVALVASAGGGFLSWTLISRSGALDSLGAEHPVSPETADIRDLMQNGAVVALEPFIVNLADTEAPRYLRVTISLMVDDKTIVQEVTENITMMSKTRDVILQTLSRKKSSEIIDEEGKNHLRTEILERLEPFHHEPKVVDVMFTEFVIQL
jgi:flagellar FliL protein